MRKVFQDFRTVDYDAVCKEYSNKLDAERVGVDRGAMQSMFSVARTGDDLGGGTSSLPVPPPPRPPAPPKRRKR